MRTSQPTLSFSSPEDAMAHCIDNANESARTRGGPFAALVIGHDWAVLASATNRIVLDADPTAHAELLAIRIACQRMGSHKLPSGTRLFSSCEPCRMCAAAIHLSGIESVYFSALDEHSLICGFAANRLRDFDAKEYLQSRRVLVSAGLLATRSLEPFQIYSTLARESYTPDKLKKGTK